MSSRALRPPTPEPVSVSPVSSGWNSPRLIARRRRVDRTPKAGVAGSKPAGGTTPYRSDLGFLSREGLPLGLGLLVRGRLREQCVSGRRVDLRNFFQRISIIRRGLGPDTPRRRARPPLRGRCSRRWRGRAGRSRQDTGQCPDNRRHRPPQGWHGHISRPVFGGETDRHRRHTLAAEDDRYGHTRPSGRRLLDVGGDPTLPDTSQLTTEQRRIPYRGRGERAQTARGGAIPASVANNRARGVYSFSA